MLSISGKSSSASLGSLAVRQDDKPKADKSSVHETKKDTTRHEQPDVLTLSVPLTVPVPAKTVDDKSVQTTGKAQAASSDNAAAKAAEKLIAELEKSKELVTKLDPQKSEDAKSEKAKTEQPESKDEESEKVNTEEPKSDRANREKHKTDEPLPPVPESKPPSDSTSTTPPTKEPTKPADPPTSGGSSSDGSTSTTGTSKTFVLVKVHERVEKGKDLSTKFDALQKQFKALSDKVDDLNAVSEKLVKLTERFENLIKVMFQGGKGGNLNLANLNAALAVARLSQNVALGFGGGGSQGDGALNGLLQNLSGIGGFVHSQNLLLQNKGLDGTLRSVTQLKKAFESQLASLSDQIQELGGSLDAKA